MPNRPNATILTSDDEGYRIPSTDLRLIFHEVSKPIAMKDSLVILVQGLFSATERINAGGKIARESVGVISHKYGDVQIQMVGYRGQLWAFKAAQAFEGLATIGAKIGFYESTILVIEDRVGPIAKVDLA